MSKLTLPIVADKKYVRRDGMVITAELPNMHTGIYRSGYWLSTGDNTSSNINDYVYSSNGRVSFDGFRSNDLVADYKDVVMNPTRHPHYENMLQYAEDSLTTTEA